MAAERWRQIDTDSYGLLPYDISNMGRVRSRRTKEIRLLKPRLGGKLYLEWNFIQDGKRMRRSTRVSSAVCRAFKRKIEKGEGCVHLDGNYANCAASNLRIRSMSRITKDTWKARPWSRSKKTYLSADAVRLICELYRTGYSQNKIAKATGVDQPRVHRIVHGVSGSRPGGVDIDVDFDVLGDLPT